MSDFDVKYRELEKKAASATGEAKTKSEQQLKALKYSARKRPRSSTARQGVRSDLG